MPPPTPPVADRQHLTHICKRTASQLFRSSCQRKRIEKAAPDRRLKMRRKKWNPVKDDLHIETQSSEKYKIRFCQACIMYICTGTKLPGRRRNSTKVWLWVTWAINMEIIYNHKKAQRSTSPAEASSPKDPGLGS